MKKKLLLTIILLFFNKIILSNKEIIQGPIKKEFIKQFLPSNPIILEAGAHHGYDTVEFAKLFPESTIYAFEPLPSNFEYLKNNCKNYKNIFCIQKALSNQTKMQKFYLSANGWDYSSSLLKPKEHLVVYPWVKFDGYIEVEAINLDDWCNQNNIKKIDFLWFDMQGMDAAVLRGARNILKTVKCIITEVSRIELYEGCELYESYKKFLIENGFELIQENIYSVTQEGDVLFVRR